MRIEAAIETYRSCLHPLNPNPDPQCSLIGLSQVKHATFLTAKSHGGTPEWMAPEVLRSESRVDEKSDIFSFGVVLYELATGEEPWKSLSNPIQVVGAVGYNGQRLPIPSDVQPEIASLLNDCWSEEPSDRPSFTDIIQRLNELKQLTPSMQSITDTAAKES